MKIKVCDAIMGSGKTSATINLFNSQPDKKYIYITPYLDEAKRIKDSCPELKFVEPNNSLPEYKFSKYNHTMELLQDGRNITSTHQMFGMYTPETIEVIREQGYTLVIDEAVDTFEDAKMTADDFNLLKAAGWLSDKEQHMSIDTHDYKKGRMEKFASLAKSNRLVQLSRKEGGYTKKVYYWMLSKEIFESFEDVYILTYLFDHQTMKYYFDLNDVQFEKIWISHPSKNEYYFSTSFDYMPEYIKDLEKKIHIFDNEKLNDIGEDRCALSSSWIDRAIADPKQEHIGELRRNIRNYFRNYYEDIPASARLWSVFTKAEPFIRDKGFFRSDLAFNKKATNEFRDKTVLAYCVNIFMQTCVKQHFIANGIKVNEDGYALSIMVQWIWRSAIRDGKEVWLYIPSKRMRTLLINWINETQQLYYDIKESKGA